VTLANGTTAVLKLGVPQLATDLHAGNVLRARRAPWLVIDPKPFVGDPAYDATQHLLNCSARLRSDPDRLIRRFADLLSADHDRVRLWLFARVVTRRTAGVAIR
jgi:streptomycin 6-kinase